MLPSLGARIETCLGVRIEPCLGVKIESSLGTTSELPLIGINNPVSWNCQLAQVEKIFCVTRTYNCPYF